MLIALSLVLISLTQVAGLFLIAKALTAQVPDRPPLETATIHPTISSDYEGLV